MKRKIRKKNNILKQEKGAVATLVLFTILMFVVILTGAYFTISTMQSSQLKSDMRIRDIYGKDVERIDEVYQEYSDILNGKDEPGNPTFTTVANAPDINGFNKEKTYYVEWNLNEAETEYIVNEVNMKEVEEQEKTIPNNWYDYTNGVNHWANVKTTGGENDCYWVWIPRYAYKVPTKGNTAETIEVKFLQGTSNIPIGEAEAITNTTPTPGQWVVHPAFTTAGNGGFGELTGIWVAKFEASSNSSTVVENPTVAQLATDGGSDTDTDLKVRVKPNVTSWRKITANDIFTVCKNLTLTGNSLENTSNLDSHMMKNTDWGACAYLSRSIYGKNSEVWNNPYYNNTANFSPITGLCSNETDGKDKGITDITKTCKYNEVGGGNASTTGNVYGIYDMAGGAWECVAGYLSEITALTNYTTLANAELKYKDIYIGTSSDRNILYNANAGKYGDAIYETSSSGDSFSDSWDSSHSLFPNTEQPMVGRGGRASIASTAGLFAFGQLTGEAITDGSFRPVVLSPNKEEPQLQELIETTDENQLKEKVTGDSSYGTGYEPWNAFDGIIDKDSNSWEATGGFPHYIQYKFDNEKTVKQIKFYPQNGSHAGRLPGQSVVSCSNDGINYTTVFEGVLCQDVEGWQTIDIQNTQRISGKYWKIEISGTASGTTPASIGEMVLIGY